MSRLFCLFLFVFSFFGLPAAIASSGDADLTIEISTELTVPDRSVLLEEIAAIRGDASLVLRVAGVQIDTSSGFVTPELIVNALKNAGIGGVRLKLLMPSSLPLCFEGEVERIVRRLSGWKWRVSAEPLSDVCPGRIVSPRSIQPGTGSVSLRFRYEDGSERALPLRLDWICPAVIAVRPLSRGDRIRPEDLGIRPVSYLRGQRYVSDMSLVCGRMARRDIERGSPLDMTDFEDVAVIERGARIRLVARVGGLVVEAKGKALQDGGTGEVIRVRNLRSRKIVLGRILRPGVVEVKGR